MALKPCIGCGRPTPGSRCRACAIVHPRGRPYDRLRHRVLARDGWRCAYCGGPANVVDHITPLAAGGHPTDPANLTA
ncbi:MAG: HNH endonuclease signature motif containing protein, partial [Solirubrobacteraceae bacterium]